MQTPRTGPLAGLLAGLLGLGLAGCAADPPARPPNLVMILVDTLRADHLGCYGYPRPLSPHIDALAGAGTLFENAFAQSSWTGPSVASLFTSTYPSRHAMTHFGASLGEELPTLAEELRRAGYRTLAVSANFAFVSQQKGLLRGFDRSAELSRRARPGEKAELLGMSTVDGSVVTDRAIALLDEEAGGPFFLYVHYMDPHSGYRLNPALPEPGPAYRGPLDGSTQQLQQVVRGELPIDERDRARLVALYDGEIARVDAEVGRLLRHLHEIGAYDESLVVLLSDHGEEFLDHGSLFHMFTLYREQIHVPLIVRRPADAGGGARVAQVVELVDVGPTLLELLGVGDSRQTAGRSLLAAMQQAEGGASGARDAEAFSELHGDPLVAPAWREKQHHTALTTRDWSLITGAHPQDFELYDRAADPAQTDDRAGQEEGRGVLEALVRRLSSRPTRVWEPPEPTRLDDAEAERLRALGYLD